MGQRIGYHRVGSPRRPRYVDADGRPVADEAVLERIRSLVIPPAWTDVWISRSARAKLQATGVDAAGRKQYLYHASYREQREKEKYDKLIRFAERLPVLREAMSHDMELDSLTEDRVAAIAVRLINLGWFRVGTERYAKQHRTFGISTLRKSHVSVRGSRVTFTYRGKHGTAIRSAIVDAELATSVRELLDLPGQRLFQFEEGGELRRLDCARLNAYIRRHMGEGFSAKDFRTWGGTLVAAVALAEHGPAATATEAKRTVAAVMRTVGEKLGNTPAVARSSYVSPAVVEQYLDGRTIADFRPRHLRIVEARAAGLDAEELATLSLLRSWRIRAARAAA